MNIFIKRNSIFIMGALFLLAGCAVSNPTRHVAFNPLVDGGFSASSAPVEFRDESEGTLLKKGYAKIGKIEVEQVIKRCTPNPKGKVVCKDITHKIDPTSELLKESSGRGGELVTLTIDKRESAKSFSRQVCAYWHSVPTYRYVYNYSTKMMDLRLVNERKCALHKKVPVYDYTITSKGFIWRHEPEIARVQRFGREFVNAAAMGNLRDLRKFLAEGLDVNMRNLDGELALGVAAGYGQIESVKFLLDNGAGRAAWIARKSSEPAPKDSSWTKAPRVRTLPDQFVVCLFKNDTRSSRT